jgi:hypothetical protein
MKSKLNRREFLIKGSRAGMSACALMFCAKLPAKGGSPQSTEEKKKEILDPKKLNYCGYKCPADCPFLKASVKNDAELKKKAYDMWKIKERFGVDFDPEKIFCFGCKTTDKPEGIVLKKCTVRTCAMEKKLDCCIECTELVACEKDLWKRFPKFKEKVIGMQKEYLKTKT